MPDQSDSADGLFSLLPVHREATTGPCRDIFQKLNRGLNNVAKTTPLEFIRQVRTETAKVVWPTGRETMMTGVMVVIMTTVLALFFLAVDTTFNAIVKALLSLAK